VVYPGADGSFVLYEDEGNNYNYENGAYTTIELKWENNSRILTIGKRCGSFCGMEEIRTFIIKADEITKEIKYLGEEISINL
jgi:alpha-D-xyloside xylohydrolase